ncbi:MAG: hypothetical protein IJP36_02570 [Bacteroides sp.]|nr:hypothetical protein [Bacteroides sp.]
MEDKIYFADYITEEFKSKIDSLGKSRFTDSSTLEVKDYTFIFVDETEYISKQVEEKDLSITKIDDFIFDTIVVLLNSEREYAGYWNSDIKLIGIFDNNGNDSSIWFPNFEMTSFVIASDFKYSHYDRNLVNSIDITMFNNPFDSYLKKALKPVRNALNSLVAYEKDYHTKSTCKVFDIEERKFPITINFQGIIRLPDDFDKFLQYLKHINDKFKEEFYHFGCSTFKPEKYLK